MNKIRKDDVTINRVYGNQWWDILWDAIGISAINAEEEDWLMYEKLRANLLSESRRVLKDSNIDMLGIRYPNKYLNEQRIKREREGILPPRRRRRAKSN